MTQKQGIPILWLILLCQNLHRIISSGSSSGSILEKVWAAGHFLVLSPLLCGAPEWAACTSTASSSEVSSKTSWYGLMPPTFAPHFFQQISLTEYFASTLPLKVSTSPRPKWTQCHFIDKNQTVLMVTDLRGPLKGLLSGIESLSLSLGAVFWNYCDEEAGWMIILFGSLALKTSSSHSTFQFKIQVQVCLKTCCYLLSYSPMLDHLLKSSTSYFSLFYAHLYNSSKSSKEKGSPQKMQKVSQLRHGFQPCTLVQSRWPDEFPYVCIWNSIWI